jgi:hypothetical protein
LKTLTPEQLDDLARNLPAWIEAMDKLMERVAGERETPRLKLATEGRGQHG